MAASSPTVSEVLGRIAHDLVAEEASTEAAALQDLPDGVHRHRTQVRRLRAVLAAMRDLLDPARTARLEVALREWGHQLGEVRDAEVRIALALAAIEDAGVDDEDVRARLVDPERLEYDRLHARLVELRASPRAIRRDLDLRGFGARPAVLVPEQDATDVLGRLLQKEAHRVRRAGRRLDDSLERHHDLRKAGRRLRYVAEAIADAAPDLFGDAVRELAEAGEDLHDLLGDHRDQLLLARRIARARVHAVRAGEAPAPYDAMITAARGRASGRLDGVDRTMRRLRRSARAVGAAR